MIYTDDTLEIDVPNTPQRSSTPLFLPASIPRPQATQATSARSQAAYSPKIDGLLLNREQQREFKLALIWIFVAMPIAAAVVAMLLLLFPLH